METWLRISDCRYGPEFRKVNASGTVELTALHPRSLPEIPARHVAKAGLTASGYERLTSHGLRAGFVTEAYRAGARDEEIMGHTRHRDLKTMRGYVRRAKLLTKSPVKKLGLQEAVMGPVGAIVLLLVCMAISVTLPFWVFRADDSRAKTRRKGEGNDVVMFPIAGGGETGGGGGGCGDGGGCE